MPALNTPFTPSVHRQLAILEYLTNAGESFAGSAAAFQRESGLSPPPLDAGTPLTPPFKCAAVYLAYTAWLCI